MAPRGSEVRRAPRRSTAVAHLHLEHFSPVQGLHAVLSQTAGPSTWPVIPRTHSPCSPRGPRDRHNLRPQPTPPGPGWRRVQAWEALLSLLPFFLHEGRGHPAHAEPGTFPRQCLGLRMVRITSSETATSFPRCLPEKRLHGPCLPQGSASAWLS